MKARMAVLAVLFAHPGLAQELLWEVPTSSQHPVAGAADVDRDGSDDFLVGAVVYSGATGEVIFDLDPQMMNFFVSVDGVGDFDGDGWPDLGLTPALGFTQIRSGFDASTLFSGCAAPLCSIGSEVRAAGDIDGNGLADVVFCEADLFGGGGAVEVLGGPGGTSMFHADSSDTCDEVAFYSVAGPGDLDGDGLDDFVFTTFNQIGYCQAGEGTIARSDSTGVLWSLPEFQWVEAIGDVDLDGRGDVLAWNVSGVRVLSGIDGSVLLDLPGVPATDAAGPGDIDCDGFPDFLVGDANDATGGDVAGAVRLYSGRDGSLLLEVFGAHGDRLGLDVDGAGDVNGDAIPDWIAAGIPYARVYSGAGLTTSVYCTAKTNSLGCVPKIGFGGDPTLSGPDDFTVRASDVLAGKPGLFFWSVNGTAAIPFLGGTLCALPPLTRTPVAVASGNAGCEGTLGFYFSQAYAASTGVNAGQSVTGQFWSRDPAHLDGTGVGLTDAIAVQWCP